jgi:hypothetical protein
MKRLLIFGYICGVLLVSGFARADEGQESLPIRKVTSQEGSWVVQIQGIRPNLCVTSPHPTLVQSAERPDILTLKMMAESNGDFCAQAVAGFYDVSVDLRRLVRQSKVQLLPGVTYTIETEGYPIKRSFDTPIYLMSREGVVEVSGMLMRSRVGELALMTDEKRLILVDPRLVDVTDYINKHVSVVGHFGPLQTAGSRMMLPSRDQLPRLTQRLTIVEITSTDR